MSPEPGVTDTETDHEDRYSGLRTVDKSIEVVESKWGLIPDDLRDGDKRFEEK